MRETLSCYPTKLGSAGPMRSKAKQLTLDSEDEKNSVSHKVPSIGSSKENGQLILQRPELPDGFWGSPCFKTRASLVAQMVNNLLAMQETRV